MPAKKNRRLFRKKRLSLFSITMLLINIVVVTLLIGSYFAAFVNPETFIGFSFLGLAYPFFLLANLIFVVYWLFKFKWQFLISFIAIAMGWQHVESLAQFNVNDNSLITLLPKNLKVVSYNLKYQGRFLSGEDKINARVDILNTIQDLNADIYCFQEFHTNSKSKSNNNLKAFAKKLKPINYFNTKMQVNEDNFNELGLAFFTKLPIINKQVINFDNTINMGAYIDIVYLTDTVRVFNMHLASIRFEKEDYKFIESFDTQKSEEEIKKGSKGIYTRLKIAFKKRGIQANIMAKQIAKSPYPVIVCGDFNDTPTSYAYNIVKGNILKDTFVEKGFGMAKTYNGSMPNFRIDHILTDSTFTTESFNVVNNIKASDHYPVVVELSKTIRE